MRGFTLNVFFASINLFLISIAVLFFFAFILFRISRLLVLQFIKLCCYLFRSCYISGTHVRMVSYFLYRQSLCGISGYHFHYKIKSLRIDLNFTVGHSICRVRKKSIVPFILSRLKGLEAS